MNFLKVHWVSKHEAWSQLRLDITVVNLVPTHCPFPLFPLRMSFPDTENMAQPPSRKNWNSGHTCPVSAFPPSRRRPSHTAVKIHTEKENARFARPLLGKSPLTVVLREYLEKLSNNKCQNKPKKTEYLPSEPNNITELGLTYLISCMFLQSWVPWPSFETSLDHSRLFHLNTQGSEYMILEVSLSCDILWFLCRVTIDPWSPMLVERMWFEYSKYTAWNSFLFGVRIYFLVWRKSKQIYLPNDT